MKQICVFCGRTLIVIKVGIQAIEYQDKAKTVPYRVWQCDLLACPSCNYQAARFADKATELFHETFEQEVINVKDKPSTIHFF